MPTTRTNQTKENGKRPPEYTVWAQMKSRCQNPKATGYCYWGGRGITVCARWQHFENFLADMGSRPSKKHTLDRIDNDGPYSPENCRWATRKQQANNKQTTVYATYKGKTLSVDKWAKKTGLPAWVIRTRLNNGWPVREALLTYLRGKCRFDPSFSHEQGYSKRWYFPPEK